MKILIINGHPAKKSLCNALVDSYSKGAKESGAEIKIMNLSDMDFQISLDDGYNKRIEHEECLISAADNILWADHLVFVYPNWWGLMPAKMKGFIDRVFLPGITFKYRENSLLWDKLLSGKSARLIVTMDSPPWYYRLVVRAPGHNAMKRAILGFCGVKPVRITSLGSVKGAKKKQIDKWLNMVGKLGRRMK